MDQQTKDKLVDGAEAKMRTTYHGKDGRFASPMSAVSANRNGERLRVVRQLRRLKQGRKAEERDRVMRTVLRSNLAKQKAAMNGVLSAPGFISVDDLF